jgi:hypothetical protein
MVFDAREAAEKASWESFEFIGLDGETYQLPNVASMTGAQTTRFNEGDPTVLEEITDPDTYAALMALPNGVAEDLVRLWQRHGSAGKGPSPSSATRPRAKRSK